MGIINVSPDSFFSGSRVYNTKRAVVRALRFEDLGADIIDVGGESTRPGASGIGIDEEKRRVLPVLEGIRKRSNVTLSVDTYKPDVAAEAIERGAAIVNDISGLRFEDGVGEVVSQAGVYIVLMHMRGRPRNMQQYTEYGNLIEDISGELDVSIDRAIEAGISKSRIIIDPGIGFAKTAEQNLQIIKHLELFKKKGYPLLVGLSRKSFLGASTGLKPEDRLVPTIAANAIAILHGADIIRVHDVKEAAETVKIADAVRRS
ncbi:MAG: dihydropteroate synthase [Spirochaetes bacterium]|nr:dihydropteroate synthase [Spirochaetota bacterium]